MKKGFTLLEVLVAAMLLGMLVTILTMVFSQSSVAWRTGIAGVADLDSRRQDIARKHFMADAALPWLKGENGNYLVVSPWKGDGSGKLRRRSVEKAETAGFSFNRPESWVGLDVNGSMNSIEMRSFVVGVTSAGPDGAFNTGDEITTLPKKKEKK